MESAASPKFLTAQWRWLVMANFEVDPALVRPLAPKGVEIDFWNGRTYVSLVGFLFTDTRVMGVPIPFHRDFEEVNLRFYVRYRSAAGWRRGVTFVKEIVPKPMIAVVANSLYNENYVTMPMRHELAAGRVRYEWQSHSRWHHLEARFSGGAGPLREGSEAEFITEHYWGYTAQRDGGTMEYRVEHPRWRVWETPEVSWSVDGAAVYGAEWGRILESRATSTFLAEGSEIAVYRGVRVA